jgi:hypothetical protein
MLELPHTIVGATLAAKIGNPLLSLPLAFLSNFVLDMLPHWNPHLTSELKNLGKISKKTTLIIFLDTLLSLIAGTFIAFKFFPDGQKIVVVLAGCFLAVLADLSEAPYFFLGIRSKFTEKTIGLQKKLQWNAPFIPGIISQIVLLVFCFWLIFQ